jgi:hypothetical protein
MADPALVEAAARNNAEWCDAFCRAHGMAPAFATERWFSAVRTPPYYPDVVTLVPGLRPEAVLDGVDAGVGCSVKDSFGDVDLTRVGFEVLFPAEWLVLAAAGVRRQPPRSWSRITDDAQLAAWEAAWGDAPTRSRFFPNALLSDDRLAFLAKREAGLIAAGAAASRSAEVVGLGNVFDAQGDLASAWAAAAAMASELWSDLPLVAYDHGEPLDAARRAGFESIGRLRVWIRPG